MSIETIKEKNLEKRISEEATIHARLIHDSILRMYGLCQDDKYIYLVLEYCRFGDLKKFLQRHQIKTLPEGEGL